MPTLVPVFVGRYRDIETATPPGAGTMNRNRPFVLEMASRSASVADAGSPRTLAAEAHTYYGDLRSRA